MSSTVLHLGAKSHMPASSWAWHPLANRMRFAIWIFRMMVNNKMVDYWVMVDFPHVLSRLGVDVLNGEGQEKYVCCKVEVLPWHGSGAWT